MTYLLQMAVLVTISLLALLMLSSVYSLFSTKVPFVPSSKKLVKLLFQTVNFKKGATFIDLGAGDGRVLFQAEKVGLKAIGYEISLLPYLLYLFFRGIFQSQVKIHLDDYNKKDLSQAQYIYCYLFPELVASAWEKVKQECPSGTYFIANTFALKTSQPVQVIKDHQQKPKIFIYQT